MKTIIALVTSLFLATTAYAASDKQEKRKLQSSQIASLVNIKAVAEPANCTHFYTVGTTNRVKVKCTPFYELQMERWRETSSD